jgi:monothiol glutaredoxin
MSIHDDILHQVTHNDVVLYMKGNADIPQCGFSGVVVKILKRLGVPFTDVDVLHDPDIREGIKAFTKWPTLPQLYVKGEFVGGCDIVRDMYKSGELETLIRSHGIIA